MKIVAVVRQYGFSAIELLVVMAIAGILAVATVPSFQVWLQNLEIRNAAGSVLAGLQRARAEALARNTSVEFELGDSSSWMVREVGGEVVETRESAEGGENVTRTITPADATKVTFDNLGGVVANLDASDTFTQIMFDSAVLNAADSKDLRITISAGGNVRMCDPNSAAGSPRAC